jgi:hypothetical protein
MTAVLVVTVAVGLIALVLLFLLLRRSTELAEASSRAERLEAELRRSAEQLRAAEERADVADALWELERLRLEREWYAIGGPSMPMPSGWDGTDGTDLSAAVAVELEVIREVVGVPGHLYPPKSPVTADPATSIIVTRLAGELLRTLARGGLELSVSIVDDDELAVSVATGAVETAEDLSRLAAAASRAGGELGVQAVEDGVRVEVRLPR